MNVYELELRARCPIHAELTDIYSVRLESESLVKVEDILEFMRRFSERQVFQEDVTREIAVGLGVKAQLVGLHSGVRITSTAP